MSTVSIPPSPTLNPHNQSTQPTPPPNLFHQVTPRKHEYNSTSLTPPCPCLAFVHQPLGLKSFFVILRRILHRTKHTWCILVFPNSPQFPEEMDSSGQETVAICRTRWPMARGGGSTCENCFTSTRISKVIEELNTIESYTICIFQMVQSNFVLIYLPEAPQFGWWFGSQGHRFARELRHTFGGNERCSALKVGGANR